MAVLTEVEKGEVRKAWCVWDVSSTIRGDVDADHHGHSELPIRLVRKVASKTRDCDGKGCKSVDQWCTLDQQAKELECHQHPSLIARVLENTTAYRDSSSS